MRVERALREVLELVKELKPTVIVFGYGQNESYAGDAGLESFVRSLRVNAVQDATVIAPAARRIQPKSEASVRCEK